MTRQYQKNEAGQDCVLRYRYETDEARNQVKIEFLTPVDTTMVKFGEREMTVRQFHEAIERPDTMVENVLTGERMLKTEWLERNRAKREDKI